MHKIELTNAVKRFKKVVAVNNVNISIKDGINIILGPNGAGKSTLLKCIDGLYKLDSGSVRINGSDPYTDFDIHKYTSLLTDNYSLYDYLTVKDNIRFFGRLYRLKDFEIEQKSRKILKELDAYKYVNNRVYSLSRGTKQKIAFCRAIINDPEIVLLDEPTAFLDAGAAEQIRKSLDEIAKKGIVLFVTQRIDEVTRFNSRLLVIKNGAIIKDANTDSIYTDIFKNSEIGIRLARPIDAKKILNKNIVYMNSKTPTYIKLKIRNFKDINSNVKTLIDSGAYIASVDYAEPALEELYK
jgi:ABC-type multidrug transport system ATPase subunit